jgi:hypothetical protein
VPLREVATDKSHVLDREVAWEVSGQVEGGRRWGFRRGARAQGLGDGEPGRRPARAGGSLR